MGEEKNPVLDFDWDRDMAKVRPPYRGVVQPVERQALIESLRRGTTNNANWRVQVDPSDSLALKNIAGKRNVHALIWKETLDKYLWQYYCLKNAQCDNDGLAGWIEVELPFKYMEKLKRIEKSQKKANAKPLPVNIEYLRFVPEAESKSAGGDCYKMPSVGHACYLNLLFRYANTRKKAFNLVLTPQYDGKKYMVHKDDPLPQFELFDYCQHEYVTAISLTIEIASIFIEVRDKLPDYDMWDKAFDIFVQKVLPKIVRSHLIFTRIAVARHFFQQIFVEQTLESYEWNPKMMDDWESNERWNLQMGRAISFLDLLDDPPEIFDLQNKQLKAALSHIENLLNRIKEPVKLSELNKRTERGLALFCNREHTNVKYFLGNLEKANPDRIPEDNVDPNNKLLIFSKVRQAVKKALEPMDNSQNSITNESEIMGKNPSKLLKIQIIRGNSDTEGHQ